MKDVEVSPTGMVRLVSLPPGPLPMDVRASAATAPEIEEALPQPLATKPDGKRPRRRGGRGRQRVKPVATASVPSASQSPS
jgi:hypothetical protein